MSVNADSVFVLNLHNEAKIPLAMSDLLQLKPTKLLGCFDTERKSVAASDCGLFSNLLNACEQPWFFPPVRVSVCDILAYSGNNRVRFTNVRESYYGTGRLMCTGGQRLNKSDSQPGPMRGDELLFSNYSHSVAGLVGSSGLRNGFAGGGKRACNIDNANAGYYYSSTRDDKHVESPISHFPLGLKVALIAPLFAIGFGIGYAALALDTGTRDLIALRVFVLLMGGLICALSLVVPFY